MVNVKAKVKEQAQGKETKRKEKTRRNIFRRNRSENIEKEAQQARDEKVAFV